MKNLRRTTHGEAHTRLYNCWKSIKSRCYWLKGKQSHRYGGRGIIVCEEWKNDFTKFRDWSLNNGYLENLTIDRIDNNGNYEPSNCRWVTHKIQGINRTFTKNKTGFRGVRQQANGKYAAQIQENKIMRGLGTYHTVEEAHQAYLKAKINRDKSYWKEFKIKYKK